MLNDDEGRTDAGDTIEGIAEGVRDGDMGDAAEAVKEDAEQTKDDVEDAVRGEDGNNS